MSQSIFNTCLHICVPQAAEITKEFPVADGERVVSAMECTTLIVMQHIVAVASGYNDSIYIRHNCILTVYMVMACVGMTYVVLAYSI